MAYNPWDEQDPFGTYQEPVNPMTILEYLKAVGDAGKGIAGGAVRAPHVMAKGIDDIVDMFKGQDTAKDSAIVQGTSILDQLAHKIVPENEIGKMSSEMIGENALAGAIGRGAITAPKIMGATAATMAPTIVSEEGQRLGLSPEQTLAASLAAGAVPTMGMGGATRRDIFAGPSANNAPRDKMFEAYQLQQQGMSPRQIWEETGIKVDAVGSTTFEIPDANATLKRPIVGGESWSLGSMIDHPELFMAYPELEGMRVSVVDNLGSRGSFAPGSNTIKVDSALKDKNFLSTLLHEVQHGVQGIEDMPSGGNSSMGKNIAKQLGDAYVYGQKKVNSLEDQIQKNMSAAGYDQAGDLLRTSRNLDEIGRLEGYLKDLRNGGKLTDKRRHILNSGDYLMDPNEESRMRAGISWPKKHRPQWEKDAAYEEYIINVLQDAKSKLDPELVAQVRDSGVANPTAKYRRQIDSINKQVKPLVDEKFQVKDQIQPALDKSFGLIPPGTVRQGKDGKYTVALLRGEKFDNPDDAIKAALDLYGTENYYNLAGEVESRLVQDRLKSGNTGNPFNEPIYREFPVDKQIYLDQEGMYMGQNDFFKILDEYLRNR